MGFILVLSQNTFGLLNNKLQNQSCLILKTNYHENQKHYSCRFLRFWPLHF